MFKMKISCDEATTICDKSQYKEASLLELIKLNLHFIFCKHCRRYTKQNQQMTKLCSQVSENNSKKDTGMSDADKEALKAQLQAFKSEAEA